MSDTSDVIGPDEGDLNLKINTSHDDTKSQDVANNLILTRPHERVSNNNADNAVGNLVVSVNDSLDTVEQGIITRHFRITSMLGQGTFGQVFRAENILTHKPVAIKIIKNAKAYHLQAAVEFEVLKMIVKSTHKKSSLAENKTYQNAVQYLIHLQDVFSFKNHLCFVFPLMKCNLYEYLSQRRFRGLTLQNLKPIVTQLLQAMVALETLEVIHCDVKPENITVSSYSPVSDVHGRPKISKISLIDFGSACLKKHRKNPYVQSRFYRAPEVLMRAQNYDNKIDVWSVGCVAMELFLGLPLFHGTSEYNQLRRLEYCLGPPPESFKECQKMAHLHHYYEGIEPFVPDNVDHQLSAAAKGHLSFASRNTADDEKKAKWEFVTIPGDDIGIKIVRPGENAIKKSPRSTNNMLSPMHLQKQQSQDVSLSRATTDNDDERLSRDISEVEKEEKHDGLVLKDPQTFAKESGEDVGPVKRYHAGRTLAELVNNQRAKMQVNSSLLPAETNDEVVHFVSLVEGLLCWDPQKRLSAKDALNHPFIVSKEENKPAVIASDYSMPEFASHVRRIQSTTHRVAQAQMGYDYMFMPRSPASTFSSATTSPLVSPRGYTLSIPGAPPMVMQPPTLLQQQQQQYLLAQQQQQLLQQQQLEYPYMLSPVHRPVPFGMHPQYPANATFMQQQRQQLFPMSPVHYVASPVNYVTSPANAPYGMQQPQPARVTPIQFPTSPVNTPYVNQQQPLNPMVMHPAHPLPEQEQQLSVSPRTDVESQPARKKSFKETYAQQQAIQQSGQIEQYMSQMMAKTRRNVSAEAKTRRRRYHRDRRSRSYDDIFNPVKGPPVSLGQQQQLSDMNTAAESQDAPRRRKNGSLILSTQKLTIQVQAPQSRNKNKPKKGKGKKK